jgi:hypothetical protein
MATAGRHLLLDGELHQLIDIARPIQQRIVGVAMQVDEGHLSFSAPLTRHTPSSWGR